METDEIYYSFDFSNWRFPSDAISIRDLRMAHSTLFDRPRENKDNMVQPYFFRKETLGENGFEVLGQILNCERVVACFAHAATCGITIEMADFDDFNIDDYKEALCDWYVKYGLATGKHHAAELIRDIERQARIIGHSKSP